MQFAILINSSPQQFGSRSALHFCKAAVKLGHKIHSVFFYQDGVLHANTLNTPPQDETNISTLWQEFAKKNGIKIIACIAACLRRGVLTKSEAKRYDKASSNFNSEFTLAGLAQMHEACIEADRILRF